MCRKIHKKSLENVEKFSKNLGKVNFPLKNLTWANLSESEFSVTDLLITPLTVFREGPLGSLGGPPDSERPKGLSTDYLFCTSFATPPDSQPSQESTLQQSKIIKLSSSYPSSLTPSPY